MSGVPQRDINTYRETKEIHRGIRLPQGDENRPRGETKAPQKDTKQLQGDTEESRNVSFNLGGLLYRRGGWAHLCPVFPQRPVITISCLKNPPFALKGQTCKTVDSTHHILMFVVVAGQIYQSTERRSMMTWEPKASAWERDSTVDFLTNWTFEAECLISPVEDVSRSLGRTHRESSPECYSISVFCLSSGCVGSSVASSVGQVTQEV